MSNFSTYVTDVFSLMTIHLEEVFPAAIIITTTFFHFVWQHSSVLVNCEISCAHQLSNYMCVSELFLHSGLILPTDTVM